MKAITKTSVVPTDTSLGFKITFSDELISKAKVSVLDANGTEKDYRNFNRFWTMMSEII